MGFAISCLLVEVARAEIIGPAVEMGAPFEVVYGMQPAVQRVGSLLVGAWSGNSISRVGWGVSADGGNSWARGALGPDYYSNSGDDACFGAATLASSHSGHVYAAYRVIGRQSGIHRIDLQRGTASSTTVSWEAPVTAVSFDPLGVRNADTPWLACDPSTDYLYLAYISHGIRYDAYLNDPGDQPLYLVRSLDGGQTWSSPLLLGGPAAVGSRVEVGESGQVYVYWQDYATHQVMVRRSDDHGSTFAAAVSMGRFVDNHSTQMRGIDSPGSYSGRQPPVNYYDGLVYDLPQIAIDRTTGPRRGTLYAVWAEAAEGTTGPSSGRSVQEAEPNDTPATANVISIGDAFSSVGESERIDPTGNSDYFAFDGIQGTVLELRGSRIQFPSSSSPFRASLERVFYLDSPSAPADHMLYLGTYLDDGTAPPMLFSLPRTTRYVIPGAFSGGPVSMVISGVLNEFLPYPNSVARDHRDIVMTWSRDGGRTWSPKVRVNDDPPGADQALPTVAVDDAGRVHVAWMDRRDGPLPGHKASPYWTTSSDGGITFQPSRRLNAPGSDYAGFENGGAIGDFIGILADGGSIDVTWPQVTSGWPVATMVRITDLPTSIAVPRFTAEPEGVSVRLAWTVEDASGITSFRVQRAPRGTEDYEIVATVDAHGNGEYSLLDADTHAGSGYRYRLEVLRGTHSSWEGPVELELPLGIAVLAFERVGPNPFADEAKMVVALPQRSWLDVRVYDVQGHEVRRLQSGEVPAGRFVLAWDGRDSGGRPAAPGVYHLRAAGAHQIATRSLVHIR